MAALTASAVKRESAGSQTKLVVTFTSINDGDTYASGLGTRIQDYVFQQSDNPTTQASAGSSVALSSGTFTFYPGEDGAAGKLIIYGTF